MILPVFKTMKEMKNEKRSKRKIRVGSVMIERLEIWITITGKKQEDMERVGGGLCQDLAEENNFLVKLKCRKKR